MKIEPPLLATLFALGCIGTPRPRAALVTKAWHASPDTNPMSSTAYRYAPWTTIESLRAGMSSTEATALIGPLQRDDRIRESKRDRHEEAFREPVTRSQQPLEQHPTLR